MVKTRGFFLGAFIALLIYNFIFPIRVNAIPMSEFILYLVLLFQAFFYPRYMLSANRLALFQPVAIATALLFVLGLMSMVFNNSSDHLSLVMVIKFIFAVVSAFIVSLMVIERYGPESLRFLMKVIVVSVLIISITCTLEFFIPAAKVFFARLINTSGNIVYEDSFRVHGLATGGGASLSVGLAVGSVLALFLAQTSKGLSVLFWGCVCFFIFVSTFFVGRTGLFLLALFYSGYFFLKLSFRSILVACVAIALLFVAVGYLDEKSLYILYSYSLEPVRNYI